MNLRQALRALRKTPSFTITVVFTLALGIGANTAVFSAIDAVLLKPLPFPDANQLMLLEQRNPRSADTFVAPPRLRDWERLNTSFQGLTGYYTQDTTELSGALPERAKVAMVAPRFLEVFGIAPALGRDFIPAETHFGGPNAVLISNRFWRRRFNADPSAVGKTLRLGQFSYTIVGVMAASFLFQDRQVDLWCPVPMDAPFAQSRQATWFTVIGRLKHGVSLDQARGNIAAVQAALGKEFGPPDSEITVRIEPLKESAVEGIGPSLWVLFGAVSVLLLIACVNITALLLARSTQRRQEAAVRFALGASRASVALQLLVEVSLLSITGAALGLALGVGASRVFRTMAAGLPRMDEIALDGRLLLYTLTTAVAAVFICGLIPAFRSSRRHPQSSLALASRTQVSTRNGLQWTLVGMQVALAVTLLAGAGLLLRSFQALGHVSPGFEPSHVLSLRITGSWADTDMTQRANRTIDFLQTIPGVERAATAVSLPGVPTEYPSELTVVEGRGDADQKIKAETRYVAPGYFDVMKIPLLEGEACRVQANTGFIPALVNRRFANTYFPNADAIGHNMRFPNPGAPPIKILGIVGDARETGLHRAPVPVLYDCVAVAQPNSVFLIRTRTEPRAMAETIRLKLRELEPGRSVYDMSPLEEILDNAFAQNRLRTVLLGFFAVTAIALASVGLYGTLSYSISLRRREVGLRLALGAMRAGIVQQFLARGLLVASLGCIGGLILAAGFTRLLADMLFGVSPWDPATLAAVVAVMLTVAASASLLPSIRASRVEPMQVLREE
jgi:putative ABC transport system permease protein